MAIIIPGYRIKEHLNEGERTSVYRGIREQDQCPVILKILKETYPSPKRIAWFKREYEILKRLNLKGIIQAYDFITYQNRLAMTLEDFAGQSLSQLIKLRPLRMNEFFLCALQVVETLGELNQYHIIHKDLNPSNIVFNPKTNQIKLIDFGISTDLSREKSALNLSKELRGTLAYISPEQTGRMNRIVDYRSDFYSLGATFYELLTEQLPFPTNDTMELIHAHIALAPPPLYERKLSIPQPLSDIVLKLMAKNAEDRYQSSYGLKTDLEECWQRWKATGRIDPFPIGHADIPIRFQLPQKLYGRQTEITTLLNTFETVCATGTSRMILVAGYSGIGKTMLVQEVHKPMTKQRGYFIAGKFDQLQRDIPYASLTQAFQSLIRQLLSENEEHIITWKEKLLEALGQNAQVIIEVIPDLQRILGPQLPVPTLGPVESQNRFNLTFQNFIQVFTRPEHPLILFVDDLQWTDTASLKLLQQLMTNLKNQTLLVIGAYRDNEVWEGHPLLITLADIQKEGGNIQTITLNALDLPTVNQIVADTVHSSLDKTLSLTQLVYGKTQGNPFFFGEFLKSLHDDHLITFNSQQGHWQWNLEQIRNYNVTDNVVDLMTKRVQKVTPETQQVLKLAACIGNQFDLQTLVVVAQKPYQDLANDLWPALFDGLILPLDEDYKVFQVELPDLVNLTELTANYRFAHDRVQQAVYSLIPAEQREKVHLQVGQLLLDNARKTQQLEQKIFDVVQQLNEGKSLLTQDSDRQELAELNLIAGRKAKASAAFKPAHLYLQTGVHLLGPHGWQTHYDLALQLHEEAAETAYLSGDFTVMEDLKQIVLQQATSKLDKIRVYQIKVQAEIGKNQPVEGINAAREALALFGIDIPQLPTPQAEADRMMQDTRQKWEKRGIETLVDLPKMHDPEKIAIARILQKLYFVSYVVDPRLYQYVVSTLVSLSIDHGNDPPSSPEGYIQYALILCGIDDIDNGYKSGKLAEQLVQKFGPEAITSAATVGCIFNGAVRVWVEHLKETLNPLLETYQIGQNTGNLMFSTLSLSFYANHLYWLGLELPQVEQEIAKYNEVLRNLKQEMFIDILDIYQQSALNWMGKAAVDNPHLFTGTVYDEGNEQEGRRKIHLKTGNYYSLAHLYLNKVVMSYGFGHFLIAKQHADTGEREYIGNVQGQGSVPVFNFYSSLSQLAAYPDLPSSDQVAVLDKVRANQQKMKMWAGYAPSNYQHKYELIEAELSKLHGATWETRDKYDQAINSAVEHGYLQDEALGNELAARFYITCNQKRVARHYLRDALYAYIRWGAVAKVQQLEKQYPDLLAQTALISSLPNQLSTTFTATLMTTTRTHHGGFGTLDFMSILKAFQALSGTILLDKLLSDLMRIIIENAGAERGLLLLETRDKWLIEAEGQAGQSTVAVLQSQPISAEKLPLTIFQYVVNSRDSLVLNDASHEENFAKDNYVLQQQPKSVLCFPLLNQGKLQGIVYLENNLTANAFTPDRIQVLSLLSTQAAISIENASLYGHQVELTDSYGRFVPTEYLKFLQKERIMDVQLGDHVSKDMAVLFSDIRSFTSLSENMTAQENFNFVNAYLKRVSPQIRDNNGFIVKYLGDGMMAVFPNGADDALRAALGKLRQVEQYNIKREREGRQAIKVGIGIHVGHMMVGMVGEVARMQGDAFSDNVNLTARLEGLTKFYGASLIISEETLRNFEDPSRYQIRFLDRVIVKGRTEAISVYEVIEGENEQVMGFKLETQAWFEKGVRCYQGGDLANAQGYFAQVLEVYPKDKACYLYLERIEKLLQAGELPENWEGVTVLTEK